jgi:hypothetical protein
MMLYGPPGIGKSCLARSVGYNFNRMRHFVHGTFWISLDLMPEHATIASLSRHILETLSPFFPDEVASFNLQARDFKRSESPSNSASNTYFLHGTDTKLCSLLTDKKVLLLLDNCDALLTTTQAVKQLQSYLGHFLERTTMPCVLMTCRRALFSTKGVNQRVFPISPLKEDFAACLLYKRIGREMTVAEWEDLKQIQSWQDLQENVLFKPIKRHLRGNPRLVELFASGLQSMDLKAMAERVRARDVSSDSGLARRVDDDQNRYWQEIQAFMLSLDAWERENRQSKTVITTTAT